jgi:hypothetical protein
MTADSYGRLSRFCLTALAGGLLAGCSSATTSPTAEAEPPLGPIPTITSPSQVALPINSYLPSPDQAVAIMLTGLSLVKACVEADGETGEIKITVSDYTSDSADTGWPASRADLISSVTNDRQENATFNGMWGFFNPETATEYGYARRPDVLHISTGSYPMGDPVEKTRYSGYNS